MPEELTDLAGLVDIAEQAGWTPVGSFGTG
jgi:hypothetical protein